MSHPHFHSMSSVRTFGGGCGDYLGLHAWLDASKSAYADTRHRAVLHHSFGIHLLSEIYGHTLVRASDGVRVDVMRLGEQHLEEDCGFRPTLEDWLGDRGTELWIERALETVPHAMLSARRLGGDCADYEQVHRWMDGGTDHWNDARAHAPLHSSFGIFLAEQRFGVTFVRASDGGAVPTRLVAEAHVIRAHGFIPTVEQWVGSIPLEPWMRRGATPLSRLLGRATTEQSHAEERIHG